MSPEKIDLVRQAIKARIEKGTKLVRRVFGIQFDDETQRFVPAADNCSCAIGCLTLETATPHGYRGHMDLAMKALGASYVQVWSFICGFDGSADSGTFCGEGRTDWAWHAAGKALFEEFHAAGQVAA